MTKKRRGVPATKAKFEHCVGCLSQYSGVERDGKTGKVLRTFNCQTHCQRKSF